jgi:hypothetical protein
MAARQAPKDFNPIFDPTKFIELQTISATISIEEITNQLAILQEDLDAFALFLQYYCVVNLSILKPATQATKINSGSPTIIFTSNTAAATREGGLYFWSVGVYPQSAAGIRKAIMYLAIDGIAQQYIVWNDPYYSYDNTGGLSLNQYTAIPLLGTFSFYIPLGSTAVCFMWIQVWTSDGTQYTVGPPGNANSFQGSSFAEFRVGNGL